MSTNELFSLSSEDATKMLICQAHVGTSKCNFQLKQYEWKQRVGDGTHIINIKKMWEKVNLAARVIAAIENPADVCVVSSNVIAQRALLKFAAHTGATPIFGRFVPGSLTNQIQKNFKEPRLLVISDSRADYQAVSEASFVNIPIISFCNTDSPMKYVDVAIPCNNKDSKSIGLMWWFLAREVLYLRGTITREIGFIIDGKKIMPDLYFYRDSKEQEQEKEDQQMEIQEELKEEVQYSAADEPKIPEAVYPTTAFDFTAPIIENWADVSSFAPTGIKDATASGAGKETKLWDSGVSGW